MGIKYKNENIIKVTKYIVAEIRKGNVALGANLKTVPDLALPQDPLIIDQEELITVANFLKELAKQWRKHGW